MVDGGGDEAVGNEPGLFYTHYRASTAGLTLEDELDELVSAGALREEQAETVRLQFDKVMSRYLRKRVLQQSSMRGRLVHYNLVDNVWTFFVRNALLRLDQVPAECVVVDTVRVGGDTGGERVGDGSAREPAASAASAASASPSVALRSDSVVLRRYAFVHVDMLRLICTAADEHMLKPTSGSSRRKRAGAPIRHRPPTKRAM
ncbi:hypothetical protein CDCA_CDCA01G0458 [Cyanidium caldarium]|uniref:Transcription initiation factor IIA subunit 2 n=1 Tax=Cyanidium caldarium TaxID=2771 RepID=A0AAV9IQB8_CYACA|nr:hypothetical protein CDCA_CDCA01G0458 [Cyanidium caldarium]